ncbi:hypothetical protein ACFL2U_02945 [Patescibacteria group bacterium]
MEKDKRKACCPMCGKVANPLSDERYLCSSTACRTTILARDVIFKQETQPTVMYSKVGASQLALA